MKGKRYTTEQKIRILREADQRQRLTPPPTPRRYRRSLASCYYSKHCFVTSKPNHHHTKNPLTVLAKGFTRS